MKKLLRRPDVQAATGLSRSGLYALIAKNAFPRPVPLTENGRSVAWDADAVEHWITSRIEAGQRG